MSRSIVATIDVRCSPAHAFETFTRRLDTWWPPGHRRFERSTLEIEGEVGGLFVERSASGEVIEHGRVLVWEPPARLVYSWKPGSIDKPTEVEVAFVASGDITVVTVTHSEADAALADSWEPRAGRFRQAWGEVLPALQTACAGATSEAEPT